VLGRLGLGWAVAPKVALPNRPQQAPAQPGCRCNRGAGPLNRTPLSAN
jgi:hypothetical protein